MKICFKCCGVLEENAKLREAINRFKNAWEDSDSNDTAWEAAMEDSRAALFSQVEEKV